MSMNPRFLARNDHEVIDKFLKFESAITICEFCATEFKSPNHSYRLSNARRHVRKHIERGEIQFPNAGMMEQNAESAEDTSGISDTCLDDSPTIIPYDLYTEFSDIGCDPLTSTELVSDSETMGSNPELLLALLFVRLALPERHMNIILEFLRLGLDFSNIKSMQQVMDSLNVASVTSHTICTACEKEIILEKCMCDTIDDAAVDTYATASLRRQLEIVCQGETLHRYNAATFRENKRITDIVDGNAYKGVQDDMRRKFKMTDESILLTLLLNTDGLQLFQSSGQSAWPVFATVSELPPERRFMPDKIVNCALWQGEGKPPLIAIMANLIDEINTINESGIIVETASGKMTAYVCCPAITCDLPAKAYAMNMKCSGSHSCPLCDIEGQSTPSGNGSCTCFVIGPDQQLRMRTAAGMTAAMNKAIEENSACFGFKGVPRIAGLPGMRITSVALIDEMHGVCLGIVKKLMLKWTEDVNEAYSLNKTQIKQIEGRQQKFLPPNFICRLPRRWKLKKWKANEFRNFLMYYSSVCLRGILPGAYYKHWLLLVELYAILCGTDISEIDLIRCKILATEFCAQTAQLYGDNTYGINFHNLLHYADMVDNFGPLWAYSLFPFESRNGWIKTHAHATMTIVNSVMRQLICSQVLRLECVRIRNRAEKRLFNMMEGKRLTNGYGFNNWVTYSALKNYAGDGQLLTGHACQNPILKSVPTAVVCGISLWTDKYEKSRKRCSKFCLIIMPDGGRIIVEIKDLIICQACRCLIILAWEQRETLVGHRLILVERKSDRIVAINSSGIKIKPCVPFVDGTTIILSIVDGHTAQN